MGERPRGLSGRKTVAASGFPAKGLVACRPRQKKTEGRDNGRIDWPEKTVCGKRGVKKSCRAGKPAENGFPAR